MKKKIIITVLVIVFISVFGLYKINKKAKNDKDFLFIENYVVTELSPTDAIIRIYAVNKSDVVVKNFPVEIVYRDKNNKIINKDRCDLLEVEGRILNPNGNMKASLNVSFSADTEKIEVVIAKN